MIDLLYVFSICIGLLMVIRSFFLAGNVTRKYYFSSRLSGMDEDDLESAVLDMTGHSRSFIFSRLFGCSISV